MRSQIHFQLTFQSVSFRVSVSEFVCRQTCSVKSWSEKKFSVYYQFFAVQFIAIKLHKVCRFSFSIKSWCKNQFSICSQNFGRDEIRIQFPRNFFISWFFVFQLIETINLILPKMFIWTNLVANGLAYRFVAGKLAIIFQFMILTSRKSRNSDFSQNAAMSDMQCCAMAFYFSIYHKFPF